jgi:L-amino acid N-acyltransferase YncA
MRQGRAAVSDRNSEFDHAPADPVRIARPEDAPAIQAIYAPYVAETAISFELEPPSVEDVAGRMKRAGSAFPWLVFEQRGQVLGYAYASAHRERAAYGWSADSTVYVARGAHRRGIGRALYGRLISILGLQGFHCLFGGITLPNAGSVALHEACGFRHVGVYREVGFKLGAWHDVGWWGLHLNRPPGEPVPPRLFSEALFNRARTLGPMR